MRVHGINSYLKWTNNVLRKKKKRRIVIEIFWKLGYQRNLFRHSALLDPRTTLESFVKGCPIDLEPKTMTAAACHLSALQPVSRTVSRGAGQRRARSWETRGAGGDIQHIRRPSAVGRRFNDPTCGYPFLRAHPVFDYTVADIARPVTR